MNSGMALVKATVKETVRRRRRGSQTGLLLQIATKVAAAETLDELLRYIDRKSVV